MKKKYFFKSKYLKVVLFILIVLLYDSCKPGRNKHTIEVEMDNLPFEFPLVECPDIPSTGYKINNYGAVPDGITNNKEAIEKAIAECVAKGGGRVIIPSGLWLTGPIELQNNIDLHLEKELYCYLAMILMHIR